MADILKDDLPAGRSVSPGRGLGDSGETKEESKEDDTTSDDERSRRRDAAGSPTRSFLAKALLLLPPPFAEAFSTLFRVVPKFLRNRPLLDINVLGVRTERCTPRATLDLPTCARAEVPSREHGRFNLPGGL